MLYGKGRKGCISIARLVFLPIQANRSVFYVDEKSIGLRHYIHFDHRIKIGNVESYVIDKDKISIHSFLPLIHLDTFIY